MTSPDFSTAPTAPSPRLILVVGPYAEGARDGVDRALHLEELNVVAQHVFEAGHIPLVPVNAYLPTALESEDEAVALEALLSRALPSLVNRCDVTFWVGAPQFDSMGVIEMTQKLAKPLLTKLSELEALSDPVDTHSATEAKVAGEQRFDLPVAEELAGWSISKLLEAAEACARALQLDDDEDERWAYVQALFARPEDSVCLAAIQWTEDEEPHVRELGCDVLGQLGVEKPFKARSVPVLLQCLLDPEPIVVYAALVALGHLAAHDVFEAMYPLVQHAEPLVRQGLAFALCGAQLEDSVPTLVTLSADPSSEVRDWATFGLGQMTEVDGPELREALVDRLNDPVREVRAEAIAGLAARKDDRAFGALDAELREDEVGSLLVEAARDLSDPRLRRALDALATWWDLDPELLHEAQVACSVDPSDA